MWCFLKWCYILLNTNQRTFIDKPVTHFSYKMWCHIKWNHRHNLSGGSSSGKPMRGTWCLRGLIVLENAFSPQVTGSNVGQAGCDLTLLLFDSRSMTYAKWADSDLCLSGGRPLHMERAAVADINYHPRWKHPKSFQQLEERYRRGFQRRDSK